MRGWRGPSGRTDDMTHYRAAGRDRRARDSLGIEALPYRQSRRNIRMIVTELDKATEHDAREETRLRRELAAVYRLVAHFKMTDLIYNHISVRLPGPEHRFLINPFGLLYEEITASTLVIIGLTASCSPTARGRSTRPDS